MFPPGSPRSVEEAEEESWEIGKTNANLTKPVLSIISLVLLFLGLSVTAVNFCTLQVEIPSSAAIRPVTTPPSPKATPSSSQHWPATNHAHIKFLFHLCVILLLNKLHMAFWCVLLKLMDVRFWNIILSGGNVLFQTYLWKRFDVDLIVTATEYYFKQELVVLVMVSWIALTVTAWSSSSAFVSRVC